YNSGRWRQTSVPVGAADTFKGSLPSRKDDKSCNTGRNRWARAKLARLVAGGPACAPSDQSPESTAYGVVYEVERRPPVETNMELKSLLEKFPMPAYACDAHGLITFYNSEAAELWGRKPQLHNTSDRYCGSFKLYAIDGSPIDHEQSY